MSNFTSIKDDKLFKYELADFCEQDLFHEQEEYNSDIQQKLKDRNLRSFNDLYKLINTHKIKCPDNKLGSWYPCQAVYAFLKDDEYLLLSYLILECIEGRRPFFDGYITILERLKQRYIEIYNADFVQNVISDLYFLIQHNRKECDLSSY